MGEIKMVSFNFPPRNWALANGQTLPVAQNQALFSLLGTTFGGNGQTTFLLPNLQGRSAVHIGNGFTLGQSSGEAMHTLTVNEIPSHNHAANVSTGNGTHAAGNTVLPGNAEPFYDPTATANNVMAGNIITNTGGNQSHENRMPFQVVNFIIALNGIYPTRN